MAKIQHLLDKIRTAIYGREVRGSLADGLEAINKETEDATEVAVNVEQRQDAVEQQFDDVLNEWTDDKPISNEETIAARTNRETGENHQTLGKRLDAENKKVNAQLAETKQEIGDKNTLPEWLQENIRRVTKEHDDYLRQFGVNVRQPPFNMAGDGTDDPTMLQTIIDYAKENSLPVFLPEGTYVFDNLKVYQNSLINSSGRQNVIIKHVGSGTAIKSVGNAGYVSISNLTIEINESTLIGIDMSGWFNGVLSKVNIFGRGNGTGIYIGEGDTRSSYYMSLYDVYIRETGKGFDLGVAANSNKFIGCRTSRVDYPVEITGDKANNNLFLGCTYEAYVTGFKLNGIANTILNCRFENGNFPGTGTGIEIVGGYRNYILLPFMASNKNNIVDNSEYLDTVIITDSLKMGGRSILDLNMVRFKPSTGSPTGRLGDFRFSDENGLLIYDSGWKKLQIINYVSSTLRPINPYSGEMIFDRSRGKPLWWNGSSWVDATGAITQ